MDVFNEIVRLTARLPGWCPLGKAVDLAGLVAASRAKTVVEIGVFGGRSFFPMALALKAGGEGRAYAVEAYDNQIAVETPTNAENDQWWATVDLRAVKRAFLSYLSEMELEGHAALVELSSDDAFQAFSGDRFRGRIDLIHVDGSHSAEQSLRDVQRWSGLLSPNGVLVVDDIAWASLAEARQWLQGTHEVICEVLQADASYGVYRRR